MRKLLLVGILLAGLVVLGRAIQAQSPRQITGVTVEFDDGSTQRIEASARTTPTRDDSRPFLGVNLEGLHDWGRSFLFIDAMKTSRQFGTAQHPYDKKAPLDADGWPTTDAGTLVMTEVKNINGVYRFFAIGRCELEARPATVRNLRYDERTNRTTAEVVVNQPADRVITLTLVFRNTDGGLRNIKLLRPGYDSDAEIFTKEFVRALAPFDSIRFMDYLRTNNSAVATWDDRPKPADAQYTIKGGPYEFAIELGNRTGKDVWICVPALADDEHVRQLGELIRTKLRADLYCYVEYSNEVWNGQFSQFKQNLDLAQAEVKAGERTLNDGGRDNNIYHWARRRVAKRSIEIKRLLGDDPRIRMVLGSQVGYRPPGTMLKQQLEYVEKHFGPPAQFFYAVASAPYFSPGRDESDPEGKRWYTQRNDITVDALCERLLERNHTSRIDIVLAFHELARKYGLKSFAYEGGLDMQQYDVLVDVKTAAQYDPRMGQAVERYLLNWYEGGGDAIFYFNLNTRYNRWGYWGLTEDVRDLTTPKFQAAVRVSELLRSGKITPGQPVRE